MPGPKSNSNPNPNSKKFNLPATILKNSAKFNFSPVIKKDDGTYGADTKSVTLGGYSGRYKKETNYVYLPKYRISSEKFYYLIPFLIQEGLLKNEAQIVGPVLTKPLNPDESKYPSIQYMIYYDSGNGWRTHLVEAETNYSDIDDRYTNGLGEDYENFDFPNSIPVYNISYTQISDNKSSLSSVPIDEEVEEGSFTVKVNNTVEEYLAYESYKKKNVKTDNKKFTLAQLASWGSDGAPIESKEQKVPRSSQPTTCIDRLQLVEAKNQTNPAKPHVLDITGTKEGLTGTRSHEQKLYHYLVFPGDFDNKLYKLIVINSKLVKSIDDGSTGAMIFLTSLLGDEAEARSVLENALEEKKVPGNRKPAEKKSRKKQSGEKKPRKKQSGEKKPRKKPRKKNSDKKAQSPKKEEIEGFLNQIKSDDEYPAEGTNLEKFVKRFFNKTRIEYMLHEGEGEGKEWKSIKGDEKQILRKLADTLRSKAIPREQKMGLILGFVGSMMENATSVDEILGNVRGITRALEGEDE